LTILPNSVGLSSFALAHHFGVRLEQPGTWVLSLARLVDDLLHQQDHPL
jgi:hypothetical protein